MPLAPGTPVGPYEVLAPIGVGGMGEVYRARDARLKRDVAVKVVRRLLAIGPSGQEEALDRLLREAVLASALNHPNIVTIYETGEFERDRYIAMELVEGATLRRAAAQGLALGRVLGIARQISEALAVAHAAQIVHRDIKPENVMLRSDGYVKLLDFGLARVQPEPVSARNTTTSAITGPGAILGTVAYMAPEQARGEPVAPEADVFALGVMLYELLTGKHPFAAPSQLGTLHALMYETPEPPGLLNPELPRAIDGLIVEMLQKDARLRPGAGEVMYRLSLAHDSSIAVALSSVAVSRSPAAQSGDVVGRDAELDALQHEFDRAARGKGRLVAISAEAGMGKTTLVDEFLRGLASRGEPARVGRGRCSQRLAGSEAYLPVLEALDSLQQNEQLGSLTRLIRALAPSWYVQIMPPTENDSSAARLAAETAAGSQERLKREIALLLEEVGRMSPVILCFDDVHWADPSTIDLIGYLARRIDNTRLLLVTTARPSELAQGKHPFLAMKLDLLSRGMCREITPASLRVEDIARYLALRFPEHAFPPVLAQVLHARTEGNPLFMADLVRDLRRRKLMAEVDGRWRLTEDISSVERELPPSVRSAIQRKLEALDDADRKLLSAASVRGVDFDTALIAGALQLPEEEVEDRLERLEREHALVHFVDEWEARDRTLTLRYRFAHHLYHEAFYESLRGTRRAAISRAIAERLVGRLGNDVDGGAAADVALLFESARDGVRAAHYWNRAAQAAGRLYAHDECARLAQRGLRLLDAEPDTPARAEAELALQMTYGLALKTGRGYAVEAVGTAYGRARELSRRVQDPSLVIPALIGLAAHHVVSGEIETSRDVALEMLAVVERLGDPNLQMIGHWALGAAQFHLGELASSHAQLSRARELYDPAYHRPRVWQTGIEPGIFCASELSRTLTLRGYPDQGLACIKQAVADARALDHPQPLAFALLFEIFAHLARRNAREVRRVYDQLAVVCHAHGIAQEVQWAAPLAARAMIELGDTRRGLRVLEEGLAAHIETRSTLLRPYYFVLLAGGLIRAGELRRAQQALDQSAAIAEATAQRAYESERARLQAELLAMDPATADAAEEQYRRALAVARAQGARWLELRAARAYAHFMLKGRRLQEARDVLVPVCAGITEGFDTLDYLYADGLAKTLG
ncbi:MAG TPA: protein kinase [Vicinamibacterales bacterium]|jgi:predicted ATPase|nr:protein kinase [Vicinamibacterales bacterium]